MKKIQIQSFRAKNYRTLLDVKIEIKSNSPVVICGENNIGKTNFLRSMNVFFNHLKNENVYKASEDIPHHIYEGSRGAGAKTELIAEFEEDGKSKKVQLTFKSDGAASYLIDDKDAEIAEVSQFLQNFEFLFIESHNVDLPSLISSILEKDGLLRLDTKRKKQTEPLKKLREFIRLSERAIADIERELNACFEKLTDFDGILKNKKIKISFAEFERLRDAVKGMTSITLHDGNTHGMASKGSGAQRAVFIALMQYISQHSKKNVIWGIDEPEAFLQPKLQKQIAGVFQKIAEEKGQPIILTTHSQHFIKLHNLPSTYLFKGTQTQKEYIRRPGQIFYEVSTSPVVVTDLQKATLIKQHLGISNNDGWELMPHNILVEGQSDKKYLETLFSLLNIRVRTH